MLETKLNISLLIEKLDSQIREVSLKFVGKIDLRNYLSLNIFFNCYIFLIWAMGMAVDCCGMKSSFQNLNPGSKFFIQSSN